MRGHLDAETVADFREDLLSGRKAARVAAHLSACPQCAEVDAQLAAVTTALAAAPTPPVPPSLAARLNAALAAEIAARAGEAAARTAGTAALTTARAAEAAGSAAAPRHTAGRRRGAGRWFSPLSLRLVAATAAVVLLAGGGYVVSRLVAGGTAIDSSPSTSWNTQFYLGNPVFGGTKTGTGLILDMGKAVRLSSVEITFGAIPGADVSIELGNSNVRAQSTLSSFTTVASATGVGGTHTFTVTSKATGRYVLIWFTKLPPKSAGSTSKFEAQIFNIIVRGSG